MNKTAVKLTPRGDMEFVFADDTYSFSPTLDNIAKIENTCGSLWQLVDEIEQNKLACHGLVKIYQALLTDIDEDKILSEILKKGAAHYMLLLLQICVPILTGLENMGGTLKGEAQPQCAGL